MVEQFVCVCVRVWTVNIQKPAKLSSEPCKQDAPQEIRVTSIVVYICSGCAQPSCHFCIPLGPTGGEICRKMRCELDNWVSVGSRTWLAVLWVIHFFVCAVSSPVVLFLQRVEIRPLLAGDASRLSRLAAHEFCYERVNNILCCLGVESFCLQFCTSQWIGCVKIFALCVMNSQKAHRRRENPFWVCSNEKRAAYRNKTSRIKFTSANGMIK